jgi:alkyl hydroperoxide reductase subunit AhpC
MQALDAAYAEFEKLNTIPLGISVDSLTSQAAWAKSLKLTKLHLLADFWPHGEVSKKLGVFIKKAGISTRANIILGKKRKVIFCRVYSLSHAPDVKELIEFLKKKIIQDAKDSDKEQEKKTEPGKGAVKPGNKKPATIKVRIKKPQEVKPMEKPAEGPVEKPADTTLDKPVENPPDKPPETKE